MSARPELALTQTKLESGLRILCAPLPATHRAAITVHVRTGSRFEPPELGGVSHFLEHMLHRGTPNHPSAHELALAFEELGSELGAATYVDHAVLSAEAPPANLARVIELMGEVVCAPIFTGIEIERGIVREEILESLDERGRPVNADELLLALAFPDHGLGRPITGVLAAVERFDVPTLERFHREHYRAPAMVVSVSGPLDANSVSKTVAQAFAAVPSGAPPSDTPPAPLGGPQFGYATDPGSQTAVRVAFRAPSETDALEPATELLLRTLDDGMSTRLYHRVCDEKGLSYDVSATYEAFSDSGLFTLAGDSAHERVEELLATLYDVARDLRDSGPTVSEVEKAKRRYAWNARAMFDSPLELAAFLGLGALTGISRTPAEREQQFDRIGADEVREAARALFVRERLAVAVVGQLSTRVRRAVESIAKAF
jgi:predicted Zn-dependent peptidase